MAILIFLRSDNFNKTVVKKTMIYVCWPNFFTYLINVTFETKRKKGCLQYLVVSPPCCLPCTKRHLNEAGPPAYLKIQDGYRKMLMRTAQNIVDDLSFLLDKLTMYFLLHIDYCSKTECAFLKTYG